MADEAVDRAPGVGRDVPGRRQGDLRVVNGRHVHLLHGSPLTSQVLKNTAVYKTAQISFIPSACAGFSRTGAPTTTGS